MRFSSLRLSAPLAAALFTGLAIPAWGQSDPITMQTAQVIHNACNDTLDPNGALHGSPIDAGTVSCIKTGFNETKAYGDRIWSEMNQVPYRHRGGEYAEIMHWITRDCKGRFSVDTTNRPDALDNVAFNARKIGACLTYVFEAGVRWPEHLPSFNKNIHWSIQSVASCGGEKAGVYRRGTCARINGSPNNLIPFGGLTNL